MQSARWDRGALVAVGALLGVLALGVVAVALADAASDRRAAAQQAEAEAAAESAMRAEQRRAEDAAFAAGVAALTVPDALVAAVDASNDLVERQDEVLTLFERGLARRENGNGRGARALWGPRAGDELEGMEAAHEAEEAALSAALDAADELDDVVAAWPEGPDGDGGPSTPADFAGVAEATGPAVTSTGDLVDLDGRVVDHLGAMRAALLDGRDARYRAQSLRLAAVLDELEQQGRKVNEALADLDAALADAAPAVEALGLTRAGAG